MRFDPDSYLDSGSYRLLLVGRQRSVVTIGTEEESLRSKEERLDLQQKENKMQYLVQMKLVAHGRPTRAEEEISFIEQVIFPSVEMCKRMQEEKKVLAGGPISATIGIAMIVEAGSALELDELIEKLPIWPLTETNVTPLTTFEDRIRSISPRLDHLKGHANK